MDVADGNINTPSASDRSATENKPKRVRTGCLTCRERHLKCDEAVPICNNCRKSSRECKRGVKLNFIDIQQLKPHEVAILLPPSPNWCVAFQDESREIAGEYKGGRAKYGAYESDSRPTSNDTFFMDMPANMGPPASTIAHPLPSMQPAMPGRMSYPEAPPVTFETHGPPSHHHHHHTHSHSESTYSGSNMPASSHGYRDRSLTPANEIRSDYLQDNEQVLYMQVFVEEVGLWMDSMDSQKHFSRLLPFHALTEPMLLNAFLACGARHLSLVNPKYSDDKPLNYYDTATRYLLNSLQDPNRDTVLCATTAVILNVYEIMCERALQRMNHIAGARALIKECGWNARSKGIGGACFWLNVGMELLSCLHFNWQVAWDPDDWGVDMDFTTETILGNEEVWTHRIVYIVAKVANFRASIPRNQEASPQDEQLRLQNRHDQWKKLKAMADAWNEAIPRTMHPLAYLYPGQTMSGSSFPEVWLIKRSAIVARLFYHTCMCLLAQINPVAGPDEPEMRQMLRSNSLYICGICAHVKDRGVASVALRSLAIAAECLETRAEQEEVLRIFDKIRQETGWRVGFLNAELKEKWGWNSQPTPDPHPHVPASMAAGNMAGGPYSVPYEQVTQVLQQPMVAPTTLPPAPPRPRPPMGILNPMLQHASFDMPHHPYHEYYVPPNNQIHNGAYHLPTDPGHLQHPQQPQQSQYPHHPNGNGYL